MIYSKKFKRQKTIFTLVVSVLVIAFSLGMAFLINPYMISTKPTNTVLPSTTVIPPDAEFVINDPMLKNAVKHQLLIEEREITREDMEKLTVLDYDAEAIKDVTGLQFAVNLKELRLKVNAMNLYALRDLHIEKLTLLSDVSAQPLMEDISKMKYLRYVDLTDCGISVIGFLSELPMIETLILDNNRISDLEYVSEMRLLSTLSLKNCGLNNITALYGNPMLQYLYIDNNRIDTLEVVNSLPALKECTYSGNPIKNE